MPPRDDVDDATQVSLEANFGDVGESWVAHAVARLDATLTPGEEIVHMGLCVVRFGVRWRAVVAVSNTHLYVAFPNVMVGTRHALRLCALRDVRHARCRQRVDEHLVVRGPTRSWRFLAVAPHGQAELVASHCVRRRSPVAARASD